MGYNNLALDCGCCDSPSLYRVITLSHLAIGTASASNHELAWDAARAQTYQRYRDGFAPSPGVFNYEAPGPCALPDPYPSIPPVIGWWERSAQKTNQCAPLNRPPILDPVVEGTGPAFGFPPQGTYHSDFQRNIIGHARAGAGGTCNAGLGGSATAYASMEKAVWMFMVASGEGRSINSLGYDSVEFVLQINQCSGDFGVLPVWVPDTYMEYQEVTPLLRENTGIEFNGFSIVVGNAAGTLQILPFNWPNNALADPRKGSYWAMTHLLKGEGYQHAFSIPCPPREANPVRLKLELQPDGKTKATASEWPEFGEPLLSDYGLNTTTAITNATERQYGLPSGAIWFIAIIPNEGMCYQDVLPADVTRPGPIDKTWRCQMWVDDAVASVNVLECYAGKTGGGQKQLVPYFSPTGLPPTL